MYFKQKRKGEKKKISTVKHGSGSIVIWAAFYNYINTFKCEQE